MNKNAHHVGAQEYAAFSRWRVSNDKRALPFKQQVREYFGIEVRITECALLLKNLLTSRALNSGGG